jgi:GxxExxY protein
LEDADDDARPATSEAADARIEKIARDIVDCGLKVHRTLGPGLLESAYETCLAHEIGSRGHSIRRQVALPVVYEGLKLEAGYRIDLLVADRVLIEVKALDALLPIHQAQVMTYLKLSGIRLGS